MLLGKNMNTNIESKAQALDNKIIDIPKTKWAGNLNTKRKRSASIVSHESEEVNCFIPKKTSKIEISGNKKEVVNEKDNEVIGYSSSDIYTDDEYLSIFEYRSSLKSVSPLDHAPFQGRPAPVLIRPSYTTPSNFIKNMKKMPHPCRQYLVRPTVALCHSQLGTMMPYHVDKRRKLESFRLAHFDHSLNSKSRENDEKFLEAPKNSEKDVSIIDAAIVLSSHFTRLDHPSKI